MSNLKEEIIGTAGALATAMALEPDVRINFSGADLVTVVAAMAVLISRGIDTLDRIHGYLAKRGCRFDREVIAFILRVYDGRDRRANLWLRGGSRSGDARSRSLVAATAGRHHQIADAHSASTSDPR